ncbi:hypothetical protein H2201_000124 [Coniosporium apollinis]|uniref:ER membrane protein complex subunit 4 n=2 Tax=Coniosporium TaxID=2810619 RepID=A0ABQ9P855_9PEZI|nr:hypothetical protein H2199_008235 [Cladosporium sp. JES 115]KAJ9669739.1 hypothetical protein H2201_000124 [Coniosporium apollinis]
MSAVQQQPPPPPPPQWVLDLNSTPSPRPRNSNIPDPPGYTAASGGKQRSKDSKSVAARKPPTTEETDTLKLKKAWELAIAPAKSLPMSAIGMYMTGNTLQIFSIFMVFTLFKGPITAILNMGNTFSRFETEGTRSKMLGVKLTFIAMNLLALGLGIYKVDAMGLLPTTRSDWLAWESGRDYLERGVPKEWL